MSFVDPRDKNALADPQWDRAGKVHDWRNHVGDHTRAIWLSLTPNQRLAIAMDADAAASNEEWE